MPGATMAHDDPQPDVPKNMPPWLSWLLHAGAYGLGLACLAIHAGLVPTVSS